jgi:hypothetical protein
MLLRAQQIRDLAVVPLLAKQHGDGQEGSRGGSGCRLLLREQQFDREP